MNTNDERFNTLYERQGGACAICGQALTDRVLTHIDHIKPRRAGGTSDPENLQLICMACDQRKEASRPDSPHPELRAAFENYLMWQRTRKRLDLTMKMSAKTPYSTDYSIGEMELLFARAHEHEKYFARLLKRMVAQIPMGEFLLVVPGTGHITAAMLLSRVDIAKAEYPSSLWKFFGLAGPSEDRYKKGVKGGGRREDRAVLRQWAESQVRLRTRYREVYDASKEKTAGEERWKSKGHRDAHAKRLMVKLFLAHFHEVYRDLVGLEKRKPYAMKHLNHDGYISPSDMGWPETFRPEEPDRGRKIS